MQTAFELLAALIPLHDLEVAEPDVRVRLSFKRAQRALVRAFCLERPGYLAAVRGELRQQDFVDGSNASVSFLETGNTSTMNTGAMIGLLKKYVLLELSRTDLLTK